MPASPLDRAGAGDRPPHLGVDRGHEPPTCRSSTRRATCSRPSAAEPPAPRRSRQYQTAKCSRAEDARQGARRRQRDRHRRCGHIQLERHEVTETYTAATGRRSGVVTVDGTATAARGQDHRRQRRARPRQHRPARPARAARPPPAPGGSGSGTVPSSTKNNAVDKTTDEPTIPAGTLNGRRSRSRSTRRSRASSTRALKKMVSNAARVNADPRRHGVRHERSRSRTPPPRPPRPPSRSRRRRRAPSQT